MIPFTDQNHKLFHIIFDKRVLGVTEKRFEAKDTRLAYLAKCEKKTIVNVAYFLFWLTVYDRRLSW